MKTPLFTLFLLASLISGSLFAQCPPPGFPEPGNTCPLAPILCPDLNGYCATINNNNIAQPFPCCAGAWILNNDEWFGFFAGTSTITIEVVPQNCTDGNMKGLQGGIYDDCPLNGCSVMDVQCSCTEDPFILSSNSYVVGEVYWIVLDGCAGNVCDYTINVLEGSTVGFAPSNPGDITGLKTVCKGTTSQYSIQLVNGATNYNWSLNPPDAGTLTTNNDSLTVAWADTFSGTAQLCVATSNQCYVSASTSCLDINVLPDANRQEYISLCPGDAVTIGGQVFNQPGTVTDTLFSAFSCDTIVTYTIDWLPYQVRTENITFCLGESVSIDGQVYNQSGIVVDTLFSLGTGCDTLITYILTQLSPQTTSILLDFCPGDSVSIGGQVYTQPGVVNLVFSSIAGCDSLVTYTLQWLTPTPSNINLSCPSSISVNSPVATTVNYALPSVSTDCKCPGTSISLTSGLPSGSSFPLGINSVCYTATDSCGQSASCCFNVTIKEEAEEDACDTKINGCLKYELLTITEDAGKNRTYRIRVTNNCTSKLLYTAIQTPDGLVAIEPANFSTYTAPSGNTYRVRNPNFSPQYSIRFSSISDSISNGESDIFKYTLPAQANVTFIHVVSRLVQNIYLGAHLNTFYCPIGITPTNDRPIGDRKEKEQNSTTSGRWTNSDLLRIFPNPASQVVRIETEEYSGELILQDAMGRIVFRKTTEGFSTEFSVETLPQGLYQVLFWSDRGTQYGTLVIQH